MFLIRAAFWLTIVLLLIPGDPKTGAEAPRVTVFQAFVAARATIADLSAFCDRNPDVCVTGSAAFQLFAEKAENGVRMLYRYFDRSEEGPVDETGGTLKREDLLPAWRGPHPDSSA
jgi:hypothetical protein